MPATWTSPHHAVAASLAGALGALALCGGLVLVLRQAVRQGETARRDTALQHEAGWRCQALHDRASRDQCLQRYRAEQPADSVSLQALVADTGAHRPPAGAVARFAR